MKALSPQAMMKSAARTFIIAILYTLTPVCTSGVFAATLNKVTGEAGSDSYDSAINQNFERVNNELIGTVHKTSTETIVGYKYFTNPVDFGTVTVDTGTFSYVSVSSSILTGNISASSGTVTNLTATSFILNGNALTAATQAQQETGTSTTVFVTSGRQQYQPSASKAWVIFQGTGTVTIRASYNVTSITDNGTGDYTVNFTTAFSSANYAFSGSTDINSVSVVCARFTTTAPTTTAARIGTFSDTGAAEDDAWVSVIFFGDQ